MKQFQPDLPYTVPVVLMLPRDNEVLGVNRKTWEEAGLILCSFRTFGGTERETNGFFGIEDTATLETWYRPDIKADCRIVTEDGKIYEITGTPENIQMRNQFMKMKVRAVSGGA